MVELVSRELPNDSWTLKIQRGMLQIKEFSRLKVETLSAAIENPTRLDIHVGMNQESSTIWTFHSRQRSNSPSPPTSHDDFVISVKTNIHSKREKETGDRRRSDIALQRPI